RGRRPGGLFYGLPRRPVPTFVCRSRYGMARMSRPPWVLPKRSVQALSRADLLRRGVGGGAVLLPSATGLSALTAPAAAAGVSDGDLSYLRVLVAAELLKADAELRALRSDRLARVSASLVRRMHADDQAHYRG